MATESVVLDKSMPVEKSGEASRLLSEAGGEFSGTSFSYVDIFLLVLLFINWCVDMVSLLRNFLLFRIPCQRFGGALIRTDSR